MLAAIAAQRSSPNFLSAPITQDASFFTAALIFSLDNVLMATSTSMMVMILTVCHPSEHDAFHGRQTSDETIACQDHEASVIPPHLGNQKRAHRPFGCLWNALSLPIAEFDLRRVHLVFQSARGSRRVMQQAEKACPWRSQARTANPSR